MILEEKIIEGHKYSVLDPQNMPKIRQMALASGEYEREWGMTKEDMLAYDDRCALELNLILENLMNGNMHQGVEHLKNTILLHETRRNMITEDYQFKPYLRAACTIILIDDEDPNEISAELNAKKIKHCKNNKEVEMFFFATTLNFIENTENSLDTSSLLKSLPLEVIHSMESQLLNGINSSIYETEDT